MTTIEIGNRKIIIGGIGKMFYQDGMPIEITADVLSEKGWEISWMHVADELFKNGWDINRIRNTLYPILSNSKYESSIQTTLIFIRSDYEHQREMIFNYLFGGSKEKAKEWFLSTVKF